jgi:O-antigen ligase/tetratricopeptide (TPR) repeat protein
MKRKVVAAIPEEAPARGGVRLWIAAVLRGLLEAVVLFLVCAAPWCYGAVHAGFEFLLLAGVGVVLVLWGARMLLEGQLSWKKCPVALCLAGLFLLGVWQITPLPPSVLGRVSPGMAGLSERLLPAKPEILPDGTGATPSATPPGRTISVYPAATRLQLARLLAICLLFAAVRNNIAPRPGLRRLGIATVLNGAALSVFALVQSLSSPPNLLYWSYPSLGQVFGPFICRNHFPYYINLCIGLGVGLLLDRGRQFGKGEGTPRSLLQDPAALWIAAGVALMAGAATYSMSRGGILALGGGAVVCLVLSRSRSVRSQRGGAILVVAALAVILAAWLGFGVITDRVATLWKGEAYVSRVALWKRMAPLATEFPAFGTGLGTFNCTESLCQNTSDEARSEAEHAHNDYLEMLLEGGVPGLLLTLLMVVLVYRLGLRAVRLGPGRRLALGALFGFSTLVIQSFGDFGLHIPAIAVLATVLCAHLVSLGAAAGLAEGDPAPEYRIRLGGIAPLLGAATLVALALLLSGISWRAHRIDRLRTTAARLQREEGEEGLAEQVACLETAARLAPEDANVQADLGQMLYSVYTRKSGQLARRGSLIAATEMVLAARNDWSAALNWSVASAAEREVLHQKEEALAREYLYPALRSYLTARNRCPVLSTPHMLLGTYATRLRQADSRQAYLARAKQLSAGDPKAWYLYGIDELAAKETAQAWESWRHCLELSDMYLPLILGPTLSALGPEEIVDKVLPDRPALLVTAAFMLYPEASAARERRPFFEKAVRVLDAQPGEPKPEDLRAKARALKGLGSPEEALAVYRQLLQQQPLETAWRFELAQILYEEHKLEDARRELVVILAQQPKNPPALELAALVSHELARQK